MNKVILIGRISNEIELKQAQSGTEVCNFSVAVDRNMGKDKEKATDFLRCVAYGNQANFISKYFSKGRRIGLEGNIKTGSYEKDNIKHYTTDIIVDRAEFVDSKPDSSNNSTSQQSAPAQTEDVEVEIISDGDIPF